MLNQTNRTKKKKILTNEERAARNQALYAFQINENIPSSNSERKFYSWKGIYDYYHDKCKQTLLDWIPAIVFIGFLIGLAVALVKNDWMILPMTTAGITLGTVLLRYVIIMIRLFIIFRKYKYLLNLATKGLLKNLSPKT